MEKVKIILDADVLIHFSKANRLSMLPNILPEYDYTILSVVYQEVKTIQQQIDNQSLLMKNLTVVPFEPKGGMRREYVKLLTKYGKGESACLAYCRFTQNVIGSSNLRDIKDYCKKQNITYLTTLDFLYYAFVRKILNEEECATFVQDVVSKGSKLPLDFDVSNYSPNAKL